MSSMDKVSVCRGGGKLRLLLVDDRNVWNLVVDSLAQQTLVNTNSGEALTCRRDYKQGQVWSVDAQIHTHNLFVDKSNFVT